MTYGGNHGFSGNFWPILQTILCKEIRVQIILQDKNKNKIEIEMYKLPKVFTRGRAVYLLFTINSGCPIFVMLPRCIMGYDTQILKYKPIPAGLIALQ